MSEIICRGHRLHYREQGQGPTLLILPGNTASSALHAEELAHFSQHFHAIAPDFLGTGQSDRLAQWPITWFDDNAGDLAQLVAQLGQGPCVAIGTSGGAIVALLLAILYPQEVRAVVADSTVEHFPPGWLEQSVAEREQHTPGQVEFWQAAHGADWPAVIAADSDMLRRFSQQGGDAFRGRLAQIRCPVLFTGSLRDPLLPDPGGQMIGMARQVRGSQVYLVAEGQHPLMWSRPAEFRRICQAYLEALSSPISA